MLKHIVVDARDESIAHVCDTPDEAHRIALNVFHYYVDTMMVMV